MTVHYSAEMNKDDTVASITKDRPAENTSDPSFSAGPTPSDAALEWHISMQ
jgi:hypothetical protein